MKFLLTIFVHASFLAFLQPACSALVSVGFVNDATTFFFGLTYVLTVSSNGSFEKTGTSVTSEYVVMFAGRKITANFTGNV